MDPRKKSVDLDVVTLLPDSVEQFGWHLDPVLGGHFHEVDDAGTQPVPRCMSSCAG
jgi:hypothetical protein